ncbi:HNH endonuclease family protein [Streptomyces sp. NPDC000927]|uniref:HNH endonuclease family protein n=1 Tax=Streptomyces sp. NPDC000927 TaxID=3154371 RepID=UPI0033342CA5
MLERMTLSNRLATWVLVSFAALTLTSCSSVPKQDTGQEGPAQTGVRQGPMREAIGELKVSEEDNQSGYSRQKFGYPSKTNGQCSTRNQVLIAEAITKPKVVEPGCKLEGGKWTSYVDNITTTDPQEMSIDHTVPLAEAWRSGASEWTSDQRSRFANDVTYAPTLTVVSIEANSAKGDKGPEGWMPPNKDAACVYIGNWIATKLHYGLTANVEEVDALKSHKECKELTMQWKGKTD